LIKHLHIYFLLVIDILDTINVPKNKTLKLQSVNSYTPYEVNLSHHNRAKKITLMHRNGSFDYYLNSLE